MLTLLQTRKLESFPVVSMGSEFWDNLREFAQKSLLANATIDPQDLELFQGTDSVEEAVNIIRRSAVCP